VQCRISSENVFMFKTDLFAQVLLLLYNSSDINMFAVALNYGVFRHRVFNSTALNYLFFDIGASGTTATIVGES